MEIREETAAQHYSDIIRLPHWEPAAQDGHPAHPRMPMDKRAAIFAPFDALSGYKEAIMETQPHPREKAFL